MPAVDCKGCNKTIRNPPSRNITGYCAKCLGRGHKTPTVKEIDQLILDKLNLKESTRYR